MIKPSDSIMTPPSGSIPKAPELQFAFEVRATIAPPLDLGVTLAGHRRVIPITGGNFAGTAPDGVPFSGRVVPGGADTQIVHPDGGADLEARYVLETNQGGLVHVLNRGIRRGDPEILARLNAGEKIDPAAIYFRSAASFETSAPEAVWLTRAIFVGTGERYPDGVIIRFFRVG